MAPDAPPPSYNRNGTQMRRWTIVTGYDDTKDVLTMSWSRPGDRLHRATLGAVAHPPADVESLLEDYTRILRMLAAPRLF